MTERRTVMLNLSAGPEPVKCIERDRGSYTELMMKPERPGETQATGSYLHFNSGLSVTNGSVFYRKGHFDVFEDGREKRQVPLTDASAAVVAAGDPLPATEEPTAAVPTDPAVSSIGFNGSHVSVDEGEAVVFFTSSNRSKN